MHDKTKVFISQPMRNRSKDGIVRERHLVMDILPKLLGCDKCLEIPMLSELTMSINSLVHCLGLLIQDLSYADVVVFVPGWHEARGCLIEHLICEEYGLSYVELQGDENGYSIAADFRK